MLEAAKRVRGSTAQGQALRVVAEHAVRMGNYSIAIDAGRATNSSSAGSETLEFVAICAAKKGNFEFATKAAKEIPSTSIHDKTTIEILKIKSEQEAKSATRTLFGEERANSYTGRMSLTQCWREGRGNRGPHPGLKDGFSTTREAQGVEVTTILAQGETL